MSIQKTNWIYNVQEEDEIKFLSENLGITKTTAKLLLNRGIRELKEARVFLNPSLNELHDPFLLKNMDKAVERIQSAIKRKESIWIYGDYDVDGVASVSIMLKYFNSINYPASYYIPNRIEEGYGINKNAIKTIANESGNLIITVDCGITSVDEVDYAKELGIDIIITDHHHCHDILPKAHAIINPKQSDCKYPCDILCGCGVAFKLIQALTPKDIFLSNIYKYLDIVSIATVADVVPLIDENRVFVVNSLNNIEKTENIGLRTLLDVCKLKDKKINSGHIGFVIAPRINAAGRIGSADVGVKLFTTDDEEEARKLAEFLDEENRNRQQLENEILEEAIAMIREDLRYTREKVLVLYKENWHHGVIGIVASRIVEEYYKPTIILTTEDEIAKGSARSISGFDLFDSLSQCQDLFIKFGGHQQAAGLSLNIENIEMFRKKINIIADKVLSEDDLIPQVYCDGHLSLEDINHQLIDELQILEPFGLGNMAPRFININLKSKEVKSVGTDGRHLKMYVEDSNKRFDTIGFNLGEYGSLVTPGDKVGVVFTPEYNIFNGHTKIQLNIKDLKIMKSNYALEKTLIKNYYKTIHFIEESFHLKNRQVTDYSVVFTENKEEILLKFVESEDKLLILVNTLKQASNLLKLTEIRKKTMYKNFKTFYNETTDFCDSNEVHIVINPNIDKIQFKLYNSIIIYDMFFNEREYLFFLDKSKGIHKTFFYSDGDEKENLQVLEEIIPNREILVIIYKFLREYKFLSEIHIEKIILEMQRKFHVNINDKLFQHALIIFAEGNLIKYSLNNDKYDIKILEAKEKINIENLSTFKYYNGLNKSFIEFKNKWLYHARGGKNCEFS